LTAALQDGVMGETADGRILVVNDAFCRICGIADQADVIGRPAQDVRDELWARLVDDVDAYRALTHRLRERRHPHLGF
jgi:PAS domain-containing protein